MGKLYLVVTPIGNLNDISYRAVETLNKVDFIACENPSNSLTLLQNFNISKKLIQVNAVHELEMSNNVIKLLKEDKDVAFISDAGFPCISDPGTTLVKLCVENDIPVTTIGGNSAFLNALLGSDIDTTRFTFIGFLSSKAGTLKNEFGSGFFDESLKRRSSKTSASFSGLPETTARYFFLNFPSAISLESFAAATGFFAKTIVPPTAVFQESSPYLRLYHSEKLYL